MVADVAPAPMHLGQPS